MFIKQLLSIVLFGTIPLMFVANNFNGGAGPAGVGGAFTARTGSWSSFYNQAGLAYEKNLSAGLFYENRFMLSQTGLKGGFAVLPFESGVASINFSSFGYSKFSQSKAGLCYSRAFGNRVAMAMQFDYIYTSISENYGNRSMITGEFGVISKLTDDLSIGAHIFNPIRVKLTEDPVETLPVVLSMGSAYYLSDKVIISLDVFKDMDQKPALKAGLEYGITEEISLRGGVSSNPFQNFFGFGYNNKGIRLDISTAIHPVLGVTPSISFAYTAL